MKAQDLRKKSEDELKSLFEDSYRRMKELRINFELGKLKNNQEIKMIKKDISRILTILRERKEKSL
ncbi:MAG TPA: 50S ribosomal protein L29 [Candidatus Paceibacterota bacterium]|jgi:large subunit ribosomal protein L29|nr:50S ribosomal protein L29 [Candidatus Paceibacterota bacterium]HOQ15409.1 50S ribosomal protein L29 [Candidatus Paceibacterota bacterium]HPQ22809.1 50S ribosomal protein L29 [Candidatus Paceibacterota bacterium]HRR45556.1 50S ribosomal protein L29 [Candidatus Paceibacterota bacterium]